MSAATLRISQKSKADRPRGDKKMHIRTKYFNCLETDYLEALASIANEIDSKINDNMLSSEDNVTLPTTEDTVSCITDDFSVGSLTNKHFQSTSKPHPVQKNKFSFVRKNRHHQEKSDSGYSRQQSIQLKKLGYNNTSKQDPIDLTNFVAPSFDFV